ncbi:MAG: response regulator transcription factor [Porticoccaceae bacterium]|nr:response regulator transcription factor [Porticoccaceae bacterium]
MNYLIIDDDRSFSAVLKRALSRLGNSVAIANNGTEAAQQCADSTFDRVVLDLKLDQESGLAILKQLKQLQPDINVLILTGYSSISTAVEAIKLGAINYLCKPASVDDIVTAFENNDGNTEVLMKDSPPSVNRLEWEHIQRVLNENQGNISATARSLGMHRRTLQRKLQKRPVKA